METSHYLALLLSVFALSGLQFTNFVPEYRFFKMLCIS